MLAIIDYGVGNLFALQSSFQYIGEPVIVTSDKDRLAAADRLLLPGVGAFGDAAQKLRDKGLDILLRELAAAGKPLLGICLGMQLLFEKSYEYGEHAGLGLIQGSVRPIRDMVPAGYKIPHIGWNALHFPKTRAVSPLFKYIHEGDHVYFVHSYAGADCAGAVIATAQYGTELTAAVANGRVYGTQFHPEKSGDVGLKILKAFCEV